MKPTKQGTNTATEELSKMFARIQTVEAELRAARGILEDVIAGNPEGDDARRLLKATEDAVQRMASLVKAELQARRPN